MEAVACGEKHTIALGVKGDLFAWGNNEFGQLGFTYVQKSPVTQPIINFVSLEAPRINLHHKK